MFKKTNLFILALVSLFSIVLGCAEDPATIKVVNHWNQIVVFSIDGNEQSRLQPLTNREVDVKAGTYKITLSLESGTKVFEQAIQIESKQFVTYHVLSDGTVLAVAGDTDPNT